MNGYVVKDDICEYEGQVKAIRNVYRRHAWKQKHTTVAYLIVNHGTKNVLTVVGRTFEFWLFDKPADFGRNKLQKNKERKLNCQPPYLSVRRQFSKTHFKKIL